MTKKKRISAFFITTIFMIVMCACGSNTIKKNQEKNNQKTSDAEVEKINTTNYCFYLKGDVLYFVESKTMKPIKLTENYVTQEYEGYHEGESVKSTEGLVFAQFVEELDMVFYPDNGVGDFRDDLYFKKLSEPDAPGTRIAGDVLCQNIVIVPESRIVYYPVYNRSKTTAILSPVIDLYEYSIDTGASKLIISNLHSLQKSDNADIEFKTTDGTWYYKNPDKDPVPTGEKSQPTDYSKGLLDSDYIKGDTRDIIKYDSGEKYYFKLDRENAVMTLCYEDSSGVNELYTHKLQNYHAITKKDTPCVVIGFSGDLIAVKGKTIIEITNKGINNDFSFSEDKSSVIFLEKNDNSEINICKIAIGKKGKKQILASNIKYFGSSSYNYCTDSSDGVYYTSKDDGFLYFNGKKVDSDTLESISGFWNDRLIYKVSEYGGNDVTLKSASKDKSTVIINSVYSMYKQDKGLWLISEYDKEKYSGDLYLYKDNDLKKVDENIVAVCSKCF